MCRLWLTRQERWRRYCFCSAAHWTANNYSVFSPKWLSTFLKAPTEVFRTGLFYDTWFLFTYPFQSFDNISLSLLKHRQSPLFLRSSVLYLAEFIPGVGVRFGLNLSYVVLPVLVTIVPLEYKAKNKVADLWHYPGTTFRALNCVIWCCWRSHFQMYKIIYLSSL